MYGHLEILRKPILEYFKGYLSFKPNKGCFAFKNEKWQLDLAFTKSRGQVKKLRV